MINKDLTASNAVKKHIKSFPVDKGNFKYAKKIAEDMCNFWDKENGNFKGNFSKGFGLHHAQVCPEEDYPLNMFVVDKELLKKEENRDQANYVFPAQVIYNPEIITSLATQLVPQKDKPGKMKAVDNVREYWEGCMSFPHRKEKKVERFGVIKVRYYIKGKLGGMKKIEEWIEGLKSHIFQHEIDHTNGIDIHRGDGEKSFSDITIEDRYLENDRTKKEVEEEVEKLEKDFIEKVKKNSKYAIIEDLHEGNPYRIKIDEEIPDGYVEGSLNYYGDDGKIKKPYDQAVIIKGDKVYSESEKNSQTPKKEETPKG